MREKLSNTDILQSFTNSKMRIQFRVKKIHFRSLTQYMKFKTKMNKKIISAIGYITIVGWVVSFILYNSGGKSPLAKYHLKQAFGLGILGTLFSILSILLFPNISLILFTTMELWIFIFLFLGINNAIKQQKRPIPLIGTFFIDRFYFI